jgi:ribosomal protein S12 methylthiotransferase accessory factor
MYREQLELKRVLDSCSEKYGLIEKIHGPITVNLGGRYLEFSATCGSMGRAKDRFAILGSSTSLDAGEALFKAIGECVERYSQFLSHPPKSKITASYGQLVEQGHRVPSFDDLMPFSRLQREYDPVLGRAFDRSTVTDWILAEGWDGGQLAVPRSWVEYLSDEEAVPFYAQNTNGTAAGPSLDFAKLNALMELIERDTFLCHWWNRIPGKRVRIKSLPLETRDRILDALGGSSVDFSDLHLVFLANEFGIPVFLCIRSGLKRSDGAAGILVSGAAACSAVEAIKKSIGESVQVVDHYLWSLKQQGKQHGKQQGKLNGISEDPRTWDQQISDFQSGVRAYLDPEFSKHARFLFEEGQEIDFDELSLVDLESRLNDPSARLREVCRQLSEAGHHVAFVDLTTRDVSEMGYSVVRAIVPEFVQLNGKHRFRQWGKRRLFRFPALLGLRERESTELELYPYPHPYP